METKKIGMSPGNRLETGTIILRSADVVDVTPIKARMKAFAKTNDSYAEAQREVLGAQARLRKAKAKLRRCDMLQDEAVEGLARTLLAEGQPRANPFALFTPATPWAIKKLPWAEEAAAIHELVDAVQRNKTVSQATLQAAGAAEQAARALEAALLPIPKLQLTLRNLRHTRDAIGQTWDNDLAALRRGARAAADDGAPALFTALFGRWATPRPARRPLARRRRRNRLLHLHRHPRPQRHRHRHPPVRFEQTMARGDGCARPSPRACGACGRRLFYGPLPVGSLHSSKSDGPLTSIGLGSP